MLLEMLLISHLNHKNTLDCCQKDHEIFEWNLDYGLLYCCTDDIAGFSDADWAGDHDDQKSISGFVFMIRGAVISWNSKKQICVALSTAGAEYIALTKAAQ